MGDNYKRATMTDTTAAIHKAAALFSDLSEMYQNTSNENRIAKRIRDNYKALQAVLKEVPDIEKALKTYTVDDELPFIVPTAECHSSFDNAIKIIKSAKLLHKITQKESENDRRN